MLRALKWTSLFLGYGFVGFCGDLAASLLAGEPALHRSVAVDVDVDVDVPDVDVRVEAIRSGRCAYEAERTVSISASAAEWLRLSAGSGELTVEGRDGADRVLAVGRACASDPSYLDELTLTLERRGDDILLSANYPDRDGRGGWRGNDYARIDLAVEVPRDMAVDLDDSSGGIEVSGTGELRIDDSSGEILVHGVNGAVWIDDSSGSIDVRDVAGDVEVDDGSGEVELADIEGSVLVRDGSGEIDVAEVEGNVEVADDGSGSIEVRNVRGDFSVRSDGSGAVRYSGIGGAVDVPRDKRRHGG
jgi:hypothetical protein